MDFLGEFLGMLRECGVHPMFPEPYDQWKEGLDGVNAWSVCLRSRNLPPMNPNKSDAFNQPQSFLCIAVSVSHVSREAGYGVLVGLAAAQVCFAAQSYVAEQRSPVVARLLECQLDMSDCIFTHPEESPVRAFPTCPH
jgi:hypothetical protein